MEEKIIIINGHKVKCSVPDSWLEPMQRKGTRTNELQK